MLSQASRIAAVTPTSGIRMLVLPRLMKPTLRSAASDQERHHVFRIAQYARRPVTPRSRHRTSAETTGNDRKQ